MTTQIAKRQVADDILERVQLNDDVFFLDLTSIDFKDSPYTALAADRVIMVDSGAGVVEILLPALAGVTNGHDLTVKDFVGNAATHNIIINPSGSETIDGSSFSAVLSTNHDLIRLVKTASDWSRMESDSVAVENSTLVGMGLTVVTSDFTLVPSIMSPSGVLFPEAAPLQDVEFTAITADFTMVPKTIRSGTLFPEAASSQDVEITAVTSDYTDV